VLRGGGVGEHLVAAIAVRDRVLAQAQLLVDHGGQGFDAVGVDFAELLDPANDRVQLGLEPRDLLVAHRDPGEPRDMADLFVRN
jgi:hypothetical protein